MSSALSALYGSQPLFVWVEDEATRVTLGTAWAGDPVAIHVGGGHGTIRAAAEDAWRGGVHHVFGVVDRDFGRSNHASWSIPPNDLRVYVLQASEVETLGLDAKALAACHYNTGQRTEAEIEARLIQIVSKMTWWMACCHVLGQVKMKRNEAFPEHPSSDTTVDLQSAMAWITGSAWFATHAHRVPALADPNWLSVELQTEEARLAASVAAGTWRSEFSGKQVFIGISNFVYTTGKGSQKHNTLLQAVVQQQANTNALPPELHALRSSLRVRVGLPP